MSRTSILVSSRNDGLLPNGNQLQRSLAFLNHKLECQCASRFDFQQRIAKFKTAQSFSISDSREKLAALGTHVLISYDDLNKLLMHRRNDMCHN